MFDRKNRKKIRRIWSNSLTLIDRMVRTALEEIDPSAIKRKSDEYNRHKYERNVRREEIRKSFAEKQERIRKW